MPNTEPKPKYQSRVPLGASSRICFIPLVTCATPVKIASVARVVITGLILNRTVTNPLMTPMPAPTAIAPKMPMMAGRPILAIMNPSTTEDMASTASVETSNIPTSKTRVTPAATRPSVEMDTARFLKFWGDMNRA
jgi:hypothetical protein